MPTKLTWVNIARWLPFEQERDRKVHNMTDDAFETEWLLKGFLFGTDWNGGVTYSSLDELVMPNNGDVLWNQAGYCSGKFFKPKDKDGVLMAKLYDIVEQEKNLPFTQGALSGFVNAALGEFYGVTVQKSGKDEKGDYVAFLLQKGARLKPKKATETKKYNLPNKLILFESTNPEKFYEVMRNYTNSGTPILCVTDCTPSTLEKTYGIGQGAKCMTLTQNKKEDYEVSATRLEFELTKEILAFAANGKGAIGFGNVVPLVMNNDWLKIYNYFMTLAQLADKTQTPIIVNVNKETMDSKQYSQLCNLGNTEVCKM